jgi:hypothetical protein
MVGGLVEKRRSVSSQEKEGCYMVMYFVYFGTGSCPACITRGERGVWMSHKASGSV